MNDTEIEEICKERLERWTKLLVKGHATPIVLVGVGHDDQGGNVIVLTLEEMSDGRLSAFLVAAVKEIAQKSK